MFNEYLNFYVRSSNSVQFIGDRHVMFMECNSYCFCKMKYFEHFYTYSYILVNITFFSSFFHFFSKVHYY
jgi:hypothetical protein